MTYLLVYSIIIFGVHDSYVNRLPEKESLRKAYLNCEKKIYNSQRIKCFKDNELEEW